MKTNNDLWTDSKCAALNVEFLTTKEELFLYANAIHKINNKSRNKNDKKNILQAFRA